MDGNKDGIMLGTTVGGNEGPFEGMIDGCIEGNSVSGCLFILRSVVMTATRVSEEPYIIPAVNDNRSDAKGNKLINMSDSFLAIINYVL